MRAANSIGMILVLLLAALPAAQEVDTAKAYTEEYDKARTLLQQRNYFEALKGFQKANQLAGGRSADCFVGMVQTMVGMKTWQNVIETAQTAIELTAGKPRLLARVHAARGTAFEVLAEKDPAKLVDAEKEFRQALDADPEAWVVDLHFNLGVVLLKQGRDAEGIAELKNEIAQRANGSTADQARALIANPRRARENYAPEFSIHTADGKDLSLESLRGTVVLLDFRASQMGARSLGPVKKLVLDHPGAPLVVVSIFVDDSPDLWRPFADKNEISWPHAWDERQRLRHDLDVKDVPAFVLIDGEGIERLRLSGNAYPGSKALTDAIETLLRR